MPAKQKTKLAVWKFASCDGCQLSLLDCEDELLAVMDKVAIAYFPEASVTETKRGLVDLWDASEGAASVIVDFGLSLKSDDPEAQGADLILLEHAFRGLHPEKAALLERVWAGYRRGFGGAELALRRAEEIRGRRRYV